MLNAAFIIASLLQKSRRIFSLHLPISYTLDNIGEAASVLLTLLTKHSVIALHGNMGAGKTTLVSHAVALSGSSDAVTSPSFSIMNQYRMGNGNILWHMDWYRLNSEEEAIDAGVEDTLFSGELCIVEWPNLYPALLPAEAKHIQISILGGGERMLQELP